MNQKRIDPYTVYTTEEAAKILGMNVKSLYKEIEKGTIVAKRAGKSWKFLGENILIYLGSPSTITASSYNPNHINAGAAVIEPRKPDNQGAATPGVDAPVK